MSVTNAPLLALAIQWYEQEKAEKNLAAARKVRS